MESDGRGIRAVRLHEAARQRVRHDWSARPLTSTALRQEIPVAHSASVGRTTTTITTVVPAATAEPSVGTLVQSAMADVSTLIRGEVELAKAEIGKSAKKAGIGAGAFGAAG